MKTLLLSLFLSTVCAFSQSTVGWTAAPGQRDVRLVTGQPVLVGTAAIGFFRGNNEWYQYGITDIREIFGEPARFAGVASSADPAFEGQQIFLRIDAGFTGGLYTSSQGWVFPDPFDLPPNNTLSINTSQIDTALYGFFDSSHLILVPEPSPQTLIIWFVVILLIVFYKASKDH